MDAAVAWIWGVSQLPVAQCEAVETLGGEAWQEKGRSLGNALETVLGCWPLPLFTSGHHEVNWPLSMMFCAITGPKQ